MLKDYYKRNKNKKKTTITYLKYDKSFIAKFRYHIQVVFFSLYIDLYKNRGRRINGFDVNNGCK